MKLLGLLRHAKSDWDDMALRDFDRGLNERGRRGAELIGRHICDYGVRWEALLASPAARVSSTLNAAQVAAPAERRDARAYLADAETLVGLIRETEGNPASLIVAGHNPGLQELVFRLVSPEEENDLFSEVLEKFPTATFAVLELDIDDWSDCEGACGKLVHLARPRDLDPELGPEKVDQR